MRYSYLGISGDMHLWYDSELMYIISQDDQQLICRSSWGEFDKYNAAKSYLYLNIPNYVYVNRTNLKPPVQF